MYTTFIFYCILFPKKFTLKSEVCMTCKDLGFGSQSLSSERHVNQQLLNRAFESGLLVCRNNNNNINNVCIFIIIDKIEFQIQQ